MRILLVHPSNIPIEQRAEKQLTFVTDHTLPLGICYLAAMLQKHNYDVSLFDHCIHNIPISEFAKWVIKKDFDVIGFSVLQTSFRTAIRIAEQIKKRNENAIIIFGGILPTFTSEKIMRKYSCVDYCVCGEGEYTLVNLIKCIESGKIPSSIDSVTYRQNGIVKSNPTLAFIQPLDDLPIPERKMLTKYHKYEITDSATPVITSRGCSFNCTFCTCGALYKRSVRFRSVENVLEEFIRLEREGFKEIEIVDDCFLIRKQRAMDICKRIKKEKLDITWHAAGRVNLGNYEIYRAMVDAGCITFSLGVESGVQRILNYYNKGITIEQTFRTVKTAKKARFESILAGFIIGAPTETLEEIKQTIKFAFKLNPTVFQFQILMVVIGTIIFDLFVKQGWISADAWEEPIFAADVCPQIVKRKLLEKIIEQNYIKFVTTPQRWVKEYLRFISSQYRLNFIKNIPNNIITLLNEKISEKSHNTINSITK